MAFSGPAFTAFVRTTPFPVVVTADADFSASTLFTVTRTVPVLASCFSPSGPGVTEYLAFPSGTGLLSVGTGVGSAWAQNDPAPSNPNAVHAMIRFMIVDY